MIIPQFKLRSPSKLGEDDTEDLQDEVSNYFEWIGLACLGSERYGWYQETATVRWINDLRLKANDKPSPYVAIYDVPSPHDVGTVTHFSCRGFLSPSYIEQVVNACTIA